METRCGTDVNSTSFPRWFNVISLKWCGNNVDSTSVCPVGKEGEVSAYGKPRCPRGSKPRSERSMIAKRGVEMLFNLSNSLMACCRACHIWTYMYMGHFNISQRGIMKEWWNEYLVLEWEERLDLTAASGAVLILECCECSRLHNGSENVVSVLN